MPVIHKLKKFYNETACYPGSKDYLPGFIILILLAIFNAIVFGFAALACNEVTGWMITGTAGWSDGAPLLWRLILGGSWFLSWLPMVLIAFSAFFIGPLGNDND